jgi:anaerobic magnesium-protoporphyrin IX monomethyl ester cyclase
MKILVVNPCLRPTSPHRYIPVGLGYVATAIKEAGYKFDLLDVDINTLSDQQVEAHIIGHKYDVVLVGSIVTHYKWIKNFVTMVRRHQKDCKIIVGNSVGSSIPEVILHYTPVDVVVLGEADITVVEVLDTISKGKSLGEAIEPIKTVPHHNGDLPSCIHGRGVQGIVFRDAKGRLIHTGSRKAVKLIDDLPFPDWDLFDVERYLDMSRTTAHDTTLFAAEDARVMPVNTARGCVFKCSFCHYVFWNDPYRHRSPENVIAEIKRNQKKYGANYINFWDELSFHKIAPAEKFVDALIEADLGIHFTAAIRTDLLGRPEDSLERRLGLARKMKQAGAVALGFSLESANEEILVAMNKRVKGDYFGEQVRVLKQAGIIANTSIIVGYPQETPATIRETLDACRRANVYPSPGFLLPMPSTGMWDHAIKHGYITDIDRYLLEITERQDFGINMTTMSDEELKRETFAALKELERDLNMGLGEERLMKTGGYKNNTKNQEETMKHRNVNDTMNYANVIGSV